MSKEIGGQFSQLEEATIVQLQAAMATGQLIARRLAEMYPERIQFLDQRGPHFNAVLEINPDAPAQERKDKWPRGRLHGISLLLCLLKSLMLSSRPHKCDLCRGFCPVYC